MNTPHTYEPRYVDPGDYRKVKKDEIGIDFYSDDGEIERYVELRRREYSDEWAAYESAWRD